MTPTSIRLAWLLALVGLLLPSCNSAPDERIPQCLNTDGFGNRYQGNAEEEDWLALGDTLAITDSYNEELSLSSQVEIDGTVLLPELGAVLVAGLTRTEIEALLMEKYSPYFESLDIKVKIITHGKKYYIFGECATQGAVDSPGDLTIFEAVTRAVPQKARNPIIITIDIGEVSQ